MVVQVLLTHKTCLSHLVQSISHIQQISQDAKLNYCFTCHSGLQPSMPAWWYMCWRRRMPLYQWMAWRSMSGTWVYGPTYIWYISPSHLHNMLPTYNNMCTSPFNDFDALNTYSYTLDSTTNSLLIHVLSWNTSEHIYFLFSIAICSPPCQHGGTCAAPNTCHCPPGWTGHRCDQGNT